MTPHEPQIVDALAAEYVLGTLRGAARRRFAHWRASSALVQERCRFWEEHLVALTARIRPERPPPHVWEGIRARLNLARSGSLPGARAARARRPGRTAAIAASVLLVAGMATLVYWRLQTGPLSETATLSAPSGTSLWSVEVYGRSGRLIVRSAQPPARPTDRDYELWALPAGGQPVSLGVLPPRGVQQRMLSTSQLQSLLNSAQIAVTLEQSGGSPSGQPTSKPLFIAPLHVIT